MAIALRECSSKLKELSLYDNIIGNDGAKALATLLSNAVNSTNLTASAAAESTLSSTPVRSTLSIRHRTKRNKKARCGYEMTGPLLHLEKISLFNNSIGDSGVEALAVALTDNTSLQTLYLDNNNIRDSGCHAIAGAIKKNKYLKRVDIQRNQITEAGGASLENALRNNITLVELACRWNDGLTVKQRRMIDRYCQDNRNYAQLVRMNGRTSNNVDDVCGLGMWPHALRIIRNRPDMLHEWLKMKPELFLFAPGMSTEPIGMEINE